MLVMNLATQSRALDPARYPTSSDGEFVLWPEELASLTGPSTAMEYTINFASEPSQISVCDINVNFE